MERLSACIEWSGPRDNRGYGIINSPGRRRTKAHRAAMAEIYGWDALVGKNVNHHCDNPGCVNTEHLYIGTQAENVQDALARGRHRGGIGEKNSHAKLTVEQVREIRAAVDATRRQLAEQYDVTPELIGQIIRGQRWRHI